MTALLDVLARRRSASAKFLVAPGPDEATLGQMLKAASLAPDHGRLVPFRFIRITESSRARLADVFVEATRQDMPDAPASELDKAREKATQGPCLLGLVAKIRSDLPKVPPSDQWLTVGCALENALLALGEAGYATAIRSGGYLETPAVRAAFGLADNEHFTCLLAIGTATDWPPAKPKPEAASLMSIW
ncbi:MAG: nitroreductase [Proteobacteria bacterium]|nr:nitroreductase [Pseudomonadota bacterium]